MISGKRGSQFGSRLPGLMLEAEALVSEPHTGARAQSSNVSESPQYFCNSPPPHEVNSYISC